MIIRSMMADRTERALLFRSGGVADVDGRWRVQVDSAGTACTYRVDGLGRQVSVILVHANLPAALAELGWEIC